MRLISEGVHGPSSPSHVGVQVRFLLLGAGFLGSCGFGSSDRGLFLFLVLLLSLLLAFFQLRLGDPLACYFIEV